MKRTVLMTDHLHILSVCKDTELSGVLTYNQMVTTAFKYFNLPWTTFHVSFELHETTVFTKRNFNNKST